jgi:hypothetical protein
MWLRYFVNQFTDRFRVARYSLKVQRTARRGREANSTPARGHDGFGRDSGLQFGGYSYLEFESLRASDCRHFLLPIALAAEIVGKYQLSGAWPQMPRLRITNEVARRKAWTVLRLHELSIVQWHD